MYIFYHPPQFIANTELKSSFFDFKCRDIHNIHGIKYPEFCYQSKHVIYFIHSNVRFLSALFAYNILLSPRSNPGEGGINHMQQQFFHIYTCSHLSIR